MAQSLALKKQDYAQHINTLATLILQLKPKIDLMVSDWFGEGYNTGPNVITQADLVAPVDYLTPAVIITVITALQGLQGVLTPTVVQQLQQAASTVPF